MRGNDFSCARATADAARKYEKIMVLPNTVVEEVSGDAALRYLRYRNSRTGKATECHSIDGETFGVFVFAGYEPAAELVRGLTELNEQGYVLADRNQPTTSRRSVRCWRRLRQASASGDSRCRRRCHAPHSFSRMASPPILQLFMDEIPFLRSAAIHGGIGGAKQKAICSDQYLH